MNLPDEVIEEAWRAMKGPRYRMVDTRAFAELESAAPVIASYAYRKGREDALTEARAEIEKHLEMEADIAADYASPEYGRGVVTGYRSALASLAGEKECFPCGGTGDMPQPGDPTGQLTTTCDWCDGTGKERTNG